MKKLIIGGLTAAVLTVSGCENLSREENIFLGGLTGAALGIMTADMLDANRNWTIVAALAGAAVGTRVAINYETDQCAYARRDGRYNIRRCY